MKKQITILCCALSLILLFTGCSKKEKTIPDIDREQIKNNIEVMVDQIVADLPDEEANGTVTYYDQAYYNGQLSLDRKQWAEKQEILKSQHELEFKSQTVYSKAIESYLKGKEDGGNVREINFDTFKISFGKEGGYEVTVDLICDKKNTQMALSYNTEMQITNAAFNVQYTTAENLQKAALNTLLGMGTVFVILILISLIISLFGIFPKLEANKKAKQAAQDAEKKAAVAPAAPAAPAAAPVAAATEDLTDDLELVAVISAAIAAYEGSEDASGYVVRSIRKSTKWQRA